MDGNIIEGVEKYQTTEEKGKKWRKKPCYDKVMKALSLTTEELNEKNWQNYKNTLK